MLAESMFSCTDDNIISTIHVVSGSAIPRCTPRGETLSYNDLLQFLTYDFVIFLNAKFEDKLLQ